MAITPILSDGKPTLSSSVNIFTIFALHICGRLVRTKKTTTRPPTSTNKNDKFPSIKPITSSTIRRHETSMNKEKSTATTIKEQMAFTVSKENTHKISFSRKEEEDKLIGQQLNKTIEHKIQKGRKTTKSIVNTAGSNLSNVSTKNTKKTGSIQKENTETALESDYSKNFRHKPKTSKLTTQLNIENKTLQKNGINKLKPVNPTKEKTTKVITNENSNPSIKPMGSNPPDKIKNEKLKTTLQKEITHSLTKAISQKGLHKGYESTDTTGSIQKIDTATVLERDSSKNLKLKPKTSKLTTQLGKEDTTLQKNVNNKLKTSNPTKGKTTKLIIKEHGDSSSKPMGSNPSNKIENEKLKTTVQKEKTESLTAAISLNGIHIGYASTDTTESIQETDTRTVLETDYSKDFKLTPETSKLTTELGIKDKTLQKNPINKYKTHSPTSEKTTMFTINENTYSSIRHMGSKPPDTMENKKLETILQIETTQSLTAAISQNGLHKSYKNTDLTGTTNVEDITDSRLGKVRATFNQEDTTYPINHTGKLESPESSTELVNWFSQKTKSISTPERNTKKVSTTKPYTIFSNLTPVTLWKHVSHLGEFLTEKATKKKWFTTTKVPIYTKESYENNTDFLCDPCPSSLMKVKIKDNTSTIATTKRLNKQENSIERNAQDTKFLCDPCPNSTFKKKKKIVKMKSTSPKNIRLLTTEHKNGKNISTLTKDNSKIQEPEQTTKTWTKGYTDFSKYTILTDETVNNSKLTQITKGNSSKNIKLITTEQKKENEEPTLTEETSKIQGPETTKKWMKTSKNFSKYTILTSNDIRNTLKNETSNTKDVSYFENVTLDEENLKHIIEGQRFEFMETPPIEPRTLGYTSRTTEYIPNKINTEEQELQKITEGQKNISLKNPENELEYIETEKETELEITKSSGMIENEADEEVNSTHMIKPGKTLEEDSEEEKEISTQKIDHGLVNRTVPIDEILEHAKTINPTISWENSQNLKEEVKLKTTSIYKKGATKKYVDWYSDYPEEEKGTWPTAKEPLTDLSKLNRTELEITKSSDMIENEADEEVNSTHMIKPGKTLEEDSEEEKEISTQKIDHGLVNRTVPIDEILEHAKTINPTISWENSKNLKEEVKLKTTSIYKKGATKKYVDWYSDYPEEEEGTWPTAKEPITDLSKLGEISNYILKSGKEENTEANQDATSPKRATPRNTKISESVTQTNHNTKSKSHEPIKENTTGELLETENYDNLSYLSSLLAVTHISLTSNEAPGDVTLLENVSSEISDISESFTQTNYDTEAESYEPMKENLDTYLYTSSGWIEEDDSKNLMSSNTVVAVTNISLISKETVEGVTLLKNVSPRITAISESFTQTNYNTESESTEPIQETLDTYLYTSRGWIEEQDSKNLGSSNTVVAVTNISLTSKETIEGVTSLKDESSKITEISESFTKTNYDTESESYEPMTETLDTYLYTSSGWIGEENSKNIGSLNTVVAVTNISLTSKETIEGVTSLKDESSKITEISESFTKTNYDTESESYEPMKETLDTYLYTSSGWIEEEDSKNLGSSNTVVAVTNISLTSKETIEGDTSLKDESSKITEISETFTKTNYDTESESYEPMKETLDTYLYTSSGWIEEEDSKNIGSSNTVVAVTSISLTSKETLEDVTSLQDVSSKITEISESFTKTNYDTESESYEPMKETLDTYLYTSSGLTEKEDSKNLGSSNTVVAVTNISLTLKETPVGVITEISESFTQTNYDTESENYKLINESLNSYLYSTSGWIEENGTKNNLSSNALIAVTSVSPPLIASSRFTTIETDNESKNGDFTLRHTTPSKNNDTEYSFSKDQTFLTTAINKEEKTTEIEEMGNEALSDKSEILKTSESLVYTKYNKNITHEMDKVDAPTNDKFVSSEKYSVSKGIVSKESILSQYSPKSPHLSKEDLDHLIEGVKFIPFKDKMPTESLDYLSASLNIHTIYPTVYQKGATKKYSDIFNEYPDRKVSKKYKCFLVDDSENIELPLDTYLKTSKGPIGTNQLEYNKTFSEQLSKAKEMESDKLNNLNTFNIASTMAEIHFSTNQVAPSSEDQTGTNQIKYNKTFTEQLGKAKEMGSDHLGNFSSFNMTSTIAEMIFSTNQVAEQTEESQKNSESSRQEENTEIAVRSSIYMSAALSSKAGSNEIKTSFTPTKYIELEQYLMSPKMNLSEKFRKEKEETETTTGAASNSETEINEESKEGVEYQERHTTRENIPDIGTQSTLCELCEFEKTSTPAGGEKMSSKITSSEVSSEESIVTTVKESNHESSASDKEHGDTTPSENESSTIEESSKGAYASNKEPGETTSPEGESGISNTASKEASSVEDASEQLSKSISSSKITSLEDRSKESGTPNQSGETSNLNAKSEELGTSNGDSGETTSLEGGSKDTGTSTEKSNETSLDGSNEDTVTSNKDSGETHTQTNLKGDSGETSTSTKESDETSLEGGDKKTVTSNEGSGKTTSFEGGSQKIGTSTEGSDETSLNEGDKDKETVTSNEGSGKTTSSKGGSQEIGTSTEGSVETSLEGEDKDKVTSNEESSETTSLEGNNQKIGTTAEGSDGTKVDGENKNAGTSNKEVIKTKSSEGGSTEPGTFNEGPSETTGSSTESEQSVTSNKEFKETTSLEGGNEETSTPSAESSEAGAKGSTEESGTSNNESDTTTTLKDDNGTGTFNEEFAKTSDLNTGSSSKDLEQTDNKFDKTTASEDDSKKLSTSNDNNDSTKYAPEFGETPTLKTDKNFTNTFEGKNAETITTANIKTTGIGEKIRVSTTPEIREGSVPKKHTQVSTPNPELISTIEIDVGMVGFESTPCKYCHLKGEETKAREQASKTKKEKLSHTTIKSKTKSQNEEKHYDKKKEKETQKEKAEETEEEGEEEDDDEVEGEEKKKVTKIQKEKTKTKEVMETKESTTEIQKGESEAKEVKETKEDTTYTIKQEETKTEGVIETEESTIEILKGTTETEEVKKTKEDTTELDQETSKTEEVIETKESTIENLNRTTETEEVKETKEDNTEIEQQITKPEEVEMMKSTTEPSTTEIDIGVIGFGSTPCKYCHTGTVKEITHTTKSSAEKEGSEEKKEKEEEEENVTESITFETKTSEIGDKDSSKTETVGESTENVFRKPIVIVINNFDSKRRKLNQTILESIIKEPIKSVDLEYVDIGTGENESSTFRAKNESLQLGVPSEPCKKSDYLNDKNCFCDIQIYMDTLLQKINHKEHIKSKDNYCENFLKLKKGLLIKNSVTPVERKRRGLIYLESLKRKGEHIEYETIEGLFENEYQLNISDINLFCLPAETVKIHCTTQVNEKGINWKFRPLSSTKDKLLLDKSAELVIHDVSMKNTGNYTCSKEDEQNITEKQHWHELEMITFPIYDIRMNIFYKFNDSCSLKTGDVLYTYLPKIVGPILCSNDNDLCTVDLDRPRCLTRADDNYFNVTIKAKMSSDFVTTLHDNCDINCKLRVYENLVNVIYKNSEILEHTPVYSILEPSHAIEFLPNINGKEGSLVNVRPPKIMVFCPSGFGLESKRQSVCVACPPHTYSGDDEAFCKTCPGGQYQPEPGAKSCIQCNSPVDNEMCLRMLYTDTKLFKIYVGVAFGFIILMVIVIIVWTSGYKDNNSHTKNSYFEGSLRHRATKRNDLDIETGVKEPLLGQTSKRLTPPQLPPVDF